MNYITTATLKEMISHASDIREFLFEIDMERRYNPGSFVQLTLGEVSASDIWPESRTFSIASFQPGVMRFIIKNEGDYTQKLFDALNVGCVCTIKYPFGDLFDKKTVDEEHVFLAGGVGITPYLGLIEYYESIGKLDRVRLFYSVREEKDLIHYETLKQKLTDRLHVYITREKSARFTSRRMTLEDIKAQSHLKSNVYVCGSKAFNQAFKSQLSASGYNKIHMDEWE